MYSTPHLVSDAFPPSQVGPGGGYHIYKYIYIYIYRVLAIHIILHPAARETNLRKKILATVAWDGGLRIFSSTCVFHGGHKSCNIYIYVLLLSPSGHLTSILHAFDFINWQPFPACLRRQPESMDHVVEMHLSCQDHDPQKC